jgi:Chromo (CHRromatin Organisation MOdifier) domain
LLTLAEFSYNNAYQSTIKCSPFYANYGYNLRFTIDLWFPQSAISAPAAAELANKLKTLYEDLIETVTLVQNDQAHYYDAKHKRIEFQKGDHVWLSSTNVHTKCLNKKLDWKRLGPFTIIEKIGLQAYRLELPKSMKIHPVFHVSLLELYRPGRAQEQPPPPVVVNDEPEYEVEDILDSKLVRRRLFYLVKWKGYSDIDNYWEPAANLKNTPILVKRFHSRYPTKPGPSGLSGQT